MKCLLCSSKNNKFIFQYKGRDLYLEKLGVNNFSLRWFECFNCGVYFSKQYNGIESLYIDQNLYDAQYDKFGLMKRFRKIINLKEKDSDNACRVKRIRDFHKQYLKNFKCNKKAFKILDVGAGTGVFLAKFLNSRYRGDALEINKLAAGHIKETLKIKVFNFPVEKLRLRKIYDIVTLNRVLEHIKNPIPVLRLVKKVLNTDGVVYLELPDSLSLAYYGKTCDAFTSGHYMAYNPESIFYLVKKSGFEILSINRVVEPSGKATMYTFLINKER